MTLPAALSRFKSACDNPDNQAKIHHAIDTQYDRIIWDIFDIDALIQIENSGKPQIRVFNLCSFNNLQYHDKAYVFDITMDQYKELEDYYFKDYVPDYDYLKSVGALIK